MLHTDELIPYARASAILSGPQRKKKTFSILLWMLAMGALLFGAGRNVLAQTGATNGSIAGTVYDPQNLPVPDSEIRATELQTGFTRTVRSNADGAYSLPLLPLGSYRLEASAAGFAHYVQSGVTVQGGRATLLPVTLSITITGSSVQVFADAASISTEPQAESYLSQKSVENLPTTTRNLWNFGVFTPGVATTPTYSFGTPGYAFGGILRREFVVDGMDDEQRAGQAKLAMFPAGAMQEVSVVQGALLPEYGSTLGGLVLESSRTGTNQYHGSVLDLERRPGLIARPSLATTRPFQERATREFLIGGSIRKDRIWGFADVEFDPQTAPVPITITAANASALGISSDQLGSAPVVSKYKMWLARTDFQLSPKQSGFVRVDYFGVPIQYNGAAALSPLSANNNYYDQDISGVGQLQTIFSPRLLNELRFADNRRLNYSHPVNGVIGGVYAITGVATLNSNATAGQSFFEHQDQFVDNVSWQKGNHTAKFGVDFETVQNNLHDRLALTFTFGASGTDAATGLPNALEQYLNTANGTTPTGYTQLSQQFGNNTAGFRDSYLGLYAQDSWKLRSNLAVDYGLRYDHIFYAALDPAAPLSQSRSIPSDGLNFSPRLGFSWQPTHKTSVRGGYSLLYDFTDLQLVGTAIRSNGSRVTSYTIAGTATDAPAFPTGFTQTPSISDVTSNVAGFASDFKTYYAHQASLTLDQDLGGGYSVQVGYLLYLGRLAPIFMDNNLGIPTGTLADGRPIYGGTRPNASFSQIQLVTSEGSSSYHGGYAAVTKRLNRGFEFAASYTWAHAINNTDASTDTLGSPGGLPSDPGNLNFDRGRASDDIRNRFTFQGVWQPELKSSVWINRAVNGWMIAPDVVLNTGFPVNELAGTDLNKDGSLNDRPVGVGRNSLTGPGFKEINLRVSRTFPLRDRSSLEAIAQAENLFNSTNAACGVATGCTGAVGNVFGSANYLHITSAVDSRQLELGGRLRF